jgi:hypothetical protein
MAGNFYREEILCCLEEAPDGWGWIGYLAVDKKHPLYRNLFVELTSATLHHVKRSTGSLTWDALWWFKFDDDRCSNEWKTFNRLKDVADELNVILNTNTPPKMET